MLSQQNNKKIDRLCPASSVIDGICTIKSKDIRLTYDFIYETQFELVFDNSEIHCVTTDNVPCKLHFKMMSSNIVLKNGSKFNGREVIIDAP